MKTNLLFIAVISTFITANPINAQILESIGIDSLGSVRSDIPPDIFDDTDKYYDDFLSISPIDCGISNKERKELRDLYQVIKDKLSSADYEDFVFNIPSQCSKLKLIYLKKVNDQINQLPQLRRGRLESSPANNRRMGSQQ